MIQMDIPFHYLGMPIGIKSSSRVVWEPLISKFEAKLSKWNQKNLSMGAKEFHVGGNQHHKRISWVKWDVICLPKNEGGLGIKDLAKFNAALRGRWIWDLAANHNQFWARVLISKYGG
ncbi:putative mitochondrial protein [Glycine soja]